MAVDILGQEWDSISGCTKISAGCKHCYAERMTEWHLKKGTSKYQAGFHKVVCHERELRVPLKRKTPQTYFVNSMADTFHKDVPLEFIQKLYKVMNDCPQHTFQVLTKRSDRMLETVTSLNYSENIWLGVSVEREDCVYRIEHLQQTPARIKFVMFEPLVGPVGTLDLTGIDWTIVGGESGDGWRKMEIDWVREIRDQCLSAGVKFVFKQFAGFNPEPLGRMLDGVLWDERPLFEWERNRFAHNSG
ncbi:DUF5131 family protein [Methylomonas sp. TEB]|uniref:DUF5131 family protein n=1 Tax=Methylomonas sp. TEB TaxID=3398229 RepID=UPI0039F48DDD